VAKGSKGKVHNCIFSASPMLRWESDGTPVWVRQDWDVIEENLFKPLLLECVNLYVFPSEPGENVNHPIAIKVREFVEENSSISESGDYIFSNPRVLINNPIAPYFWAPVRFGYRMSRLMTFNPESFHHVLRALSYSQITTRGPVHRDGNWKERDALAKTMVRNGGSAIVNDCATFQLHYSDAQISEVNSAIDFVARQWERGLLRPGDRWEPDEQFQAGVVAPAELPIQLSDIPPLQELVVDSASSEG
jgi:hypothetical protein